MTIIIGEMEKIPIARKVRKKIKIFILVSAVFLTIFITVFKTKAETAILIPAKACWIISKWENSFKKFAISVIIIIEGVIKPKDAIIPPKLPFLFLPQNVEVFTAIIPGVVCPIA